MNWASIWLATIDISRVQRGCYRVSNPSKVTPQLRNVKTPLTYSYIRDIAYKAFISIHRSKLEYASTDGHPGRTILLKRFRIMQLFTLMMIIDQNQAYNHHDLQSKLGVPS